MSSCRPRDLPNKTKLGNVPEGGLAQIVREFFPKADDDDVDYLLWNHTGYPYFWGQGGRKTVAGCVRYSLRRLKSAMNKGKVLCFACDRMYEGDRLDDLCPACQKKYGEAE